MLHWCLWSEVRGQNRQQTFTGKSCGYNQGLQNSIWLCVRLFFFNYYFRKWLMIQKQQPQAWADVEIGNSGTWNECVDTVRFLRPIGVIAAWHTFTWGSVSAHFPNGKWATKSLPAPSVRALLALLRLLSCYYSVKSCCVFQRKGSYFISTFCLSVNASAALAAIFACFNCPLHPNENIQPFFARQLSLAPQEREFPQLVWFHSSDLFHVVSTFQLHSSAKTLSLCLFSEVGSLTLECKSLS